MGQGTAHTCLHWPWACFPLSIRSACVTLIFTKLNPADSISLKRDRASDTGHHDVTL